MEAKECRCCAEIPKCVEMLDAVRKDADLSQAQVEGSEEVVGMKCITNHPGFDAVCLNQWSLELASHSFKTRDGSKYKQVDSKKR